MKKQLENSVPRSQIQNNDSPLRENLARNLDELKNAQKRAEVEVDRLKQDQKVAEEELDDLKLRIMERDGTILGLLT